MKQNTFYIIIGIIGLLEVLLFWASIQFSNPFIIAIGFIAGACLYFGLRRTVTDCYEDERQNMINMKTASATLKAFWVSFFTVNLATVVYVFSVPLGFKNITYNVISPTTGAGPEIANATGKLAHNMAAYQPPVDAYSVAITLHPSANDALAVVNSTQMEVVTLFPGPPEMIAISHLGIFGVIQILLLVLMIFIYAAFRIYYSHKFGEWDDDEE
ncbi:DUF2178 domain-containing protein [Methanorbis furvi]|uniref:DUF2178 domain-containing protein n=1 Tax=Methanorbis furvi TaxID=3028299 RepID=A0AAE4MCZ0_9EURY|nr:hypothetical protein [Methanocorpusculaceae archaeon Ag1]